MLLSAFSLIKREWVLMRRSKGQWAEPWIFLILTASLLPMLNAEAVKNNPLLGISLLWISLMMAVMLTFDKGLRQDFHDGVFEQWRLGPNPLWWLVFAKSLAHWLMWVLPMIILSPLLMVMFSLPSVLMPVTLMGFILGTPVFSFLGLVASALTLNLRASGLLLALIFIPLTVPVLILALSACASAMADHDVSGHLALLAALSVLSMVLLPHASAFGIKVSMN